MYRKFSAIALHAILCASLMAMGPSSCDAFAPSPVGTFGRPNVHRMFSSVSDEIKSMRIGEIKKELESYGISTRSFLEKSELVDALTKARADGLKPKSPPSGSSTSSTSSASSSSSSSSSSTSSAPEDSRPREERLAEEMENCKQMKAGELKKELEERGISTKSFFEKSEFVKALAEARVDNVNNKPEEGYAEYADVEVLTDSDAGPRKRQDADAGAQQSDPFGGAAGGGNPFGGAAGGANPFGGAAGGANPFGGAGGMGGMGGMGGIADMLKNMGGMGGMGSAAGGANPFGGMGGMGGMGDMMGKAQELMKNPKVMELMMKAQSNPKMAKAMQECMSNPAAFAKYQNDPEVSELINELKKYM